MKYINKLIKKYNYKIIICNNIEYKIRYFEELKFGYIVITAESIDKPGILDFIIVPLINMYELEQKGYTYYHKQNLALKKDE